MVGQLFKFFFSFLAVMASGPLVFFLVYSIRRAQIDTFFSTHPLGVGLIISLYLLFVSLMFFELQDIFMVFPPKAGIEPASKRELLSRLELAFTQPVEGKKLFDFQKSEDKAVITWSSSIGYFQGTSGGMSGMKRVVVLNLNEKKHDVFFIMKEKDWQWNLSKNFAEYSLNYSSGIFAEFRTEVHPSIEYGEHGLRIDMKKLTYSSDDLWLPIQDAVLSSGWTLRGGMLPHLYQRIALCGSLAIVLFLLLCGMMAIFKKSPATAQKGPAPSPAAEWKPQSTQQIVMEFEKITASMPTEQLRSNIEARLQMPVEYLLKGNDATVFATFARAYLSRPDRDEQFAASLNRFAEKHHLDFGK